MLNSYIIEHMEVIFIVYLMCHFKQSINLFPNWRFSQCSLRDRAIHHRNGSLDAVNVSYRLSEKATHNQEQ